MDIHYIVRLLPQFFAQLPFVLTIILVSLVISFVLAVLITIVRINHVPLLSTILSLYVSFVRSLPNILILFLVYYGLPVLLHRESLFGGSTFVDERIYYGILAIVLYNSGYTSEILRAGIQTLPKEQELLADSLGYNYLQKLSHVILPQVIVISIKDIENSIINIMKDTSVFSLLGLWIYLDARIRLQQIITGLSKQKYT